MNYNLISTFKHVGDIHIEGKNIYFVKSDSIQLYPNYEVLKLSEYWGIYFSKGLINVYTNRSYNIFYDYNGNRIESFDKINFYHIFSKNDFIYFDRNEKKTKYNSVILFDDKLGENFVEQNQLFFTNNNFVKSCDYKIGKILWQFDIKLIPNNPHNDNYGKHADWQVKKFIGVLENKLWVALNHHTIIALDLENGELVHQIHNIPTFKIEWLPSAIPLSEATVVDEKNNKLIGFMWEFYWEINPQNGEIILLDFTEDFLVQKVRNDLKSFVLTDSHIYFASHHDIKVAAFNRALKKIDWFYEFDDDDNGYQSRINKIDGNDEKLGVLTQGNILYIFEK
ncbi:hypothetical protein [Paenimyroides aestuarii]|uniref:Uncharacterized protein n=1 Tax=Paenimyroides aestuarii TaxID=2968490 RepID=A0ABY5NPI0_9FLAO|nr:hypothetical protein [Paenimyroides aestuarii]UUV20435.1 hypothetical protein NPX36_08645 [Paenimyroides aestuarii]